MFLPMADDVPKDASIASHRVGERGTGAMHMIHSLCIVLSSAVVDLTLLVAADDSGRAYHAAGSGPVPPAADGVARHA